MNSIRDVKLKKSNYGLRRAITVRGAESSALELFDQVVLVVEGLFVSRLVDRTLFDNLVHFYGDYYTGVDGP